MVRWWWMATLSECCNSFECACIKFDVDLCITFLNVQSSPKSNVFVNMINLHELRAPCCIFTWMFSTPESQRSLTLTFLWTFSTFTLTDSQDAQWMWYIFRNYMQMCCSWTGMFSTSSLMLPNVVWLFWTSKPAQGQMGGRQQHLVNTMTPKKLPASYCNFTEIFSISK